MMTNFVVVGGCVKCGCYERMFRLEIELSRAPDSTTSFTLVPCPILQGIGKVSSSHFHDAQTWFSGKESAAVKAFQIIKHYQSLECQRVEVDASRCLAC